MIVVEAATRHAAKSVAGLIGAERFEDPENARTIMLMAGGLVVLAVVVAAGTVWWWRSAKVEHPALGPLEVMGSRSWWKGDYTARRSRLDAARPGEPVAGQIDAVEAVDLDAVRRGLPPQFDDLADGPPVVKVDALEGGTLDDLDALLAAAGAVIASAHASQGNGAVAETVVAEPAVVEPKIVEPKIVEPVVVSATSRSMIAKSVAADGSTTAAEGTRAPIDPLLRSPRDD